VSENKRGFAGRALAFADAAVIKMAQTISIPVAADDWYQRRRQDEEGEFLSARSPIRVRARAKAAQRARASTSSPRRQSCLPTATIKDAAVMRGVITQALKDFQKTARRAAPARRDQGREAGDRRRQLPPRAARRRPHPQCLHAYLSITAPTATLLRRRLRHSGADKAARDHLG